VTYSRARGQRGFRDRGFLMGLVGTLLLTGLGLAARSTATVHAAATGCPAGAVPPPGSAACIEGIPHFDHVFIVIGENKSRDEIFYPGYISATNTITSGAPTMATQPVTSNTPNPYLNSLVPQGAFLRYYYGAGHFSFDNYLALTLGQTPIPTTQDDCPNYASCLRQEAISPTQQGGPNGGYSIADQLEAHGYSWKGYMDDMPAPCTHASATDLTGTDPYVGGNALGDYADRHDPFVYLPPIEGDGTRCADRVVPYTDTVHGFAADLANSSVPNYSFITPSTCNDGHDVPFCGPLQGGKLGGLVAFDQWLRGNVPPIMTYMSADAARGRKDILFVIFDESDIRDKLGQPYPNNDFGTPPTAANIDPVDLEACCTGGDAAAGLPPGGGLIGAVALSPLITPGTVTDTQYDHASLLRTIEDSFSLPYLGDANAPPCTAVLVRACERPMADLFAPAGAGGGSPPTTTPEPDTAALYATGLISLAALLLYRRRRARPDL